MLYFHTQQASPIPNHARKTNSDQGVHNINTGSSNVIVKLTVDPRFSEIMNQAILDFRQTVSNSNSHLSYTEEAKALKNIVLWKQGKSNYDLHLTVAIAKIPEEKFAKEADFKKDLQLRIGTVLKEMKEFPSLKGTSIGLMKSGHIAVKVNASPELQKVHDAVVKVLKDIGCQLEEDHIEANFKPHLTMGKANKFVVERKELANGKSEFIYNMDLRSKVDSLLQRMWELNKNKLDTLKLEKVTLNYNSNINPKEEALFEKKMEKVSFSSTNINHKNDSNAKAYIHELNSSFSKGYQQPDAKPSVKQPFSYAKPSVKQPFSYAKPNAQSFQAKQSVQSLQVKPSYQQPISSFMRPISNTVVYHSDDVNKLAEHFNIKSIKNIQDKDFTKLIVFSDKQKAINFANHIFSNYGIDSKQYPGTAKKIGECSGMFQMKFDDKEYKKLVEKFTKEKSVDAVSSKLNSLNLSHLVHSTPVVNPKLNRSAPVNNNVHNKTQFNIVAIKHTTPGDGSFEKGFHRIVQLKTMEDAKKFSKHLFDHHQISSQTRPGAHKVIGLPRDGNTYYQLTFRLEEFAKIAHLF